MMTEDDLVQLATAEGLGDHAADLVGRVRPGWRLERAHDGQARIGGHPDLGPDETWPRNSRGVPMVFLAQVDCSALPPFDPPWRGSGGWQHGGRLVRLFGDLLDNPVEPGPAIALTCDPAASLERTAAPAVPDPWPRGGEWDDWEAWDRFHVLPETTVACTPFLTALETHPVLRPELHDFSPEADRYGQWAYQLRIDGMRIDDRLEPWSVSHLLGEACSIQDDVRSAGFFVYPDDPALAEEDAWRVLLALHTDDRLGLEIHDGGAFHVLAPVNDLGQGQLDRLICDVQSG